MRYIPMQGQVSDKLSVRAALTVATIKRALDELDEDAMWEEICDEHDRDKLDRFACGFDANILREERRYYV